MDNVNLDKYEPHLYPNVDGQCDLDSSLPKEEMADNIETQFRSAHIQGDEETCPSQQDDTIDAGNISFELESDARGFDGLMHSELFDETDVPEDIEFQQLPSLTDVRKASHLSSETCV